MVTFEVLIEIYFGIFFDGRSASKKQEGKEKERTREIDMICSARRKLPLIIPHYDKLVRESEVKFDISR